MKSPDDLFNRTVRWFLLALLAWTVVIFCAGIFIGKRL